MRLVKLFVGVDEIGQAFGGSRQDWSSLLWEWV